MRRGGPRQYPPNGARSGRGFASDPREAKEKKDGSRCKPTSVRFSSSEFATDLSGSRNALGGSEAARTTQNFSPTLAEGIHRPGERLRPRPGQIGMPSTLFSADTHQVGISRWCLHVAPSGYSDIRERVGMWRCGSFDGERKLTGLLAVLTNTPGPTPGVRGNDTTASLAGSTAIYAARKQALRGRLCKRQGAGPFPAVAYECGSGGDTLGGASDATGTVVANLGFARFAPDANPHGQSANVRAARTTRFSKPMDHFGSNRWIRRNGDGSRQ
jgi:hypothetical protein